MFKKSYNCYFSHAILLMSTLGTIILPFFKTVLVLRGLWRAWSGLRVFPLSCPLHYPAVSCKPAATLGPHLGASVGPVLSLIVQIRSANENSFCYIVDLPIFVLALLCIHRTIEIS